MTGGNVGQREEMLGSGTGPGGLHSLQELGRRDVQGARDGHQHGKRGIRLTPLDVLQVLAVYVGLGCEPFLGEPSGEA
jgi:hypothetical protein